MLRKQNNSSETPLISCLMVTQQGRLDETRQSIACLSYQTIQAIELIIVHDSDDSYHLSLLKLSNAYPAANIRIYQEPPGHTLGWLRNRSLEHANAELICQWDDDDFSHPERLFIQYGLMLQEGTDFCFMTDQLHLFTKQGFMFWDDRSLRQAPYDLIENTMLGKRVLMCAYPELDRGEDTAILKHLFYEKHKISRLRDKAWLYTYVYNGKNTWGFKHHSEISQHQRLEMNELLAREVILRKELHEYEFPFKSVFMPHNNGKIEFNL